MREEKKTILYIITQAEWGGAQRYIFDLATSLQGQFEVTVAAGADGGSQELFERLSAKGGSASGGKDYKTCLAGRRVKRLTFKHLVREINPYHDVLAVFEIAKFLRQNHFDIIHLNSSKAGVIGSLAVWINKISSIFNLPCRQAGLQSSTKIIYTAHGWVYLEPLPFYQRWVYLLMEKISARLRDTTIVLSEKEKNIALRHSTAKKDKIYVVPNGIDITKLTFLSREEAKERLKIRDKRYVIGTIANLYKTKGLEYLIEAVNLLNLQSSTCLARLASASAKRAGRRVFNLQLFIIGEGPERKNLETKIKKLNLENNTFLIGAKDNAYQYLKAFDIFILPSVKEGFPYTILEAMAAGLPIVATDVGALPEIIKEKENGLLVPPADPEALAQAINKLLVDNELKETIKQKNLETVKKYSLENTISLIKKIYN